MATAQIAQPRETVPVLLSDKFVTASEVASVIPKGCRQATLEEVILRYRHDAGFRREIYDKGWTWTSQKGLVSLGDHQISEDGEFSKVDSRKFNSLSPGEKATHYPGSGLVAVGFYLCDWGDREFGVFASRGPYSVGLVAYVKEDREVTAPKNGAERSAIGELVDAAKNQLRQE